MEETQMRRVRRQRCGFCCRAEMARPTRAELVMSPLSAARYFLQNSKNTIPARPMPASPCQPDLRMIGIDFDFAQYARLPRPCRGSGCACCRDFFIESTAFRATGVYHLINRLILEFPAQDCFRHATLGSVLWRSRHVRRDEWRRPTAAGYRHPAHCRFHAIEAAPGFGFDAVVAFSNCDFWRSNAV